MGGRPDRALGQTDESLSFAALAFMSSPEAALDVSSATDTLLSRPAVGARPDQFASSSGVGPQHASRDGERPSLIPNAISPRDPHVDLQAHSYWRSGSGRPLRHSRLHGTGSRLVIRRRDWNWGSRRGTHILRHRWANHLDRGRDPSIFSKGSSWTARDLRSLHPV
jgi:hypothetical protein